MCGIIFGSRKDGKPIAKALLKRYRNQSHRGKQGFGYVTITNGKLGDVKRFENENEMEASIIKETAGEILFHHRFPTSTPNLAELNHPFVIDDERFANKYIVIHNGVISNAHSLKYEHEKKGYSYKSFLETVTTVIKRTLARNEEASETKTTVFNDSEALAFELAEYFEGIKTKIAAIGSIAFICLEVDRDDNVLKIHYGRNHGNPIVVERDLKSGIYFFKSEGGGYKMEADQIATIDYATDDVSLQEVEVGETYTKPKSATKWLEDREKEKARIVGFNTDKVRSIPLHEIDIDDDKSNQPIIDELVGEIETKIADLSAEEEDVVRCISDLNLQIAAERNYRDKDMLTIEREQWCQELVRIRKEMSKLEDQVEQITGNSEALKEIQEYHS
jgi:glucosamine 6-phosphate synthetase-like amidotransferase/phosphosugar isomerase protein